MLVTSLWLGPMEIAASIGPETEGATLVQEQMWGSILWRQSVMVAFSGLASGYVHTAFFHVHLVYSIAKYTRKPHPIDFQWELQ